MGGFCMKRKLVSTLTLITILLGSILFHSQNTIGSGFAENTKAYIKEHFTILLNEREEVQVTTLGGVSIEAPSAVLMEASTGTIIYEKASKEQLRPASITKIMTMILIFDALAEGKIKLEDTVTTSEYAASMGGSQVFLEANEQQTVETLLKCISVASANDACVA